MGFTTEKHKILVAKKPRKTQHKIVCRNFSQIKFCKGGSLTLKLQDFDQK